jgi:hypothetical protein
MRWLLTRVLAIWLLVFVLCGTVALLVRLNREPGPLEALGFDVCDGEPCFRGIKAGMNWEEAKRHLPNAEHVEDDPNHMTLSLGTPEFLNITVQRSNDGLVENVYAGETNRMKWPFIRAGDVILLYGSPCRVTVVHKGEIFLTATLIYPNQVFELRLYDRFGADTPIAGLKIARLYAGKSFCDVPLDQYEYPYYGFALAKVYEAPNRRSLGTNASRGIGDVGGTTTDGTYVEINILSRASDAHASFDQLRFAGFSIVDDFPADYLQMLMKLCDVLFYGPLVRLKNFQAFTHCTIAVLSKFNVSFDLCNGHPSCTQIGDKYDPVDVVLRIHAMPVVFAWDRGNQSELLVVTERMNT